MMRFLSTLVTLGLLSLTLTPTGTAAEQTCTYGRLFIGDKNETKLHVLDLDNYNEVGVLNVGGVNPSIYSTESGIIVTTFAGTLAQNYTDGISQFFDAGIELDDHGDHKDIDKSVPFVYDFTIRGPRASHVVDHAGYVAIFHDGYYSTDINIRQPASAYFVKHNEFKTKTSVISPVVFNPAATGGPQHGVAYALNDNRFVMSMAHPDRAAWNSTFNSPIGFGIYDKNRTLIHDLAKLDDPSKNCIGYHGSGEYMNEGVHGCNAYTNGQGVFGTVPPTPEHAGVLTMTYNPTNDTVTTRKLTYATGDGRRISTIVNQPGTNNMVGLYTTSNLTMSTSFVTVNAGHTTLLGDATRVYQNPEQGIRPCIFTFETSPTARFLVYWPNGKLKVMIPSPTWSVERTIENLPTNCGALSFTAGYNQFWISDSMMNQVHQIIISTGVIKTTQLNYTPGKLALAVPEEAICQSPGTVTPGTTTSPPGTVTPGTTTSPPTSKPTGTATTTPPTSKPTGPSSQATTIMSSIMTLLVVNLVAFIMA